MSSDKISQLTTFTFGIADTGVPQVVCVDAPHLPAIEEFTVRASVHGEASRLTLMTRSLMLASFTTTSFIRHTYRDDFQLAKVSLKANREIGAVDVITHWVYPELSEERAARLDLAERIEIHSFLSPDEEKEFIQHGSFIKVWINGLVYRGYGHEGKPYYEQVHEALLTALDSRRCEDL